MRMNMEERLIGERTDHLTQAPQGEVIDNRVDLRVSREDERPVG
jgi:hypothetical protein